MDTRVALQEQLADLTATVADTAPDHYQRESRSEATAALERAAERSGSSRTKRRNNLRRRRRKSATFDRNSLLTLRSRTNILAAPQQVMPEIASSADPGFSI